MGSTLNATGSSVRFFLPLLLIVGGCAGPAPASPAAAVIAEAEQQVSLSGLFNVIWNGEPRFMLVDERGRAVRLMIDEPLLKRFGGAQALVQKYITVAGKRVSQTPEVVEVLAIEIGRQNR